MELTIHITARLVFSPHAMAIVVGAVGGGLLSSDLADARVRRRSSLWRHHAGAPPPLLRQGATQDRVVGSIWVLLEV